MIDAEALRRFEEVMAKQLGILIQDLENVLKNFVDAMESNTGSFTVPDDLQEAFNTLKGFLDQHETKTKKHPIISELLWYQPDDVLPEEGIQHFCLTQNGEVFMGHRFWRQGSNPERWHIGDTEYHESQAGVVLWAALPDTTSLLPENREVGKGGSKDGAK